MVCTTLSILSVSTFIPRNTSISRFYLQNSISNPFEICIIQQWAPFSHIPNCFGNETDNFVLKKKNNNNKLVLLLVKIMGNYYCLFSSFIHSITYSQLSTVSINRKGNRCFCYSWFLGDLCMSNMGCVQKSCIFFFFCLPVKTNIIGEFNEFVVSE